MYSCMILGGIDWRRAYSAAGSASVSICIRSAGGVEVGNGAAKFLVVTDNSGEFDAPKPATDGEGVRRP